MVQRLLLYPGRLAVGVREDPLRQPDGVSIPEATGILPDGVEQLGGVLHRERGHLSGACPDIRLEVLVGGGDENLDPALTEGDLVIRRPRRARRAPRAGPLLRTVGTAVGRDAHPGHRRCRRWRCRRHAGVVVQCGRRLPP